MFYEECCQKLQDVIDTFILSLDLNWCGDTRKSRSLDTQSVFLLYANVDILNFSEVCILKKKCFVECSFPAVLTNGNYIYGYSDSI